MLCVSSQVLQSRDGSAQSDRRIADRGAPPDRPEFARVHPVLTARFSQSEFDTTLTELIAIAAAAVTGLRSPKAASGIPTTLHTIR